MNIATMRNTQLAFSDRGAIRPASLPSPPAAKAWTPAANGLGFSVLLPVLAGGAALAGFGVWWFLIRKKR